MLIKEQDIKDQNTIVCRCEDITRGYILKCIEAGYRTLDEIKRVTRAGMGPCQGRTCRQLIAQELSRIYEAPMEDVLMTTFRPPAKPISLGALADAYAEREGNA
jgi:NAD(P)H-nitrite reductase large subunit